MSEEENKTEEVKEEKNIKTEEKDEIIEIKKQKETLKIQLEEDFRKIKKAKYWFFDYFACNENRRMVNWTCDFSQFIGTPSIYLEKVKNIS